MIRNQSRGLLWVVLFISVIFMTAFESTNSSTRATWLWQAETIADGGQDVLEYADNQNIDHIYLRIDMNQPEEMYQTFVRNAQERESRLMHSQAILTGRQKVEENGCFNLLTGLLITMLNLRNRNSLQEFILILNPMS